MLDKLAKNWHVILMKKREIQGIFPLHPPTLVECTTLPFPGFRIRNAPAVLSVEQRGANSTRETTTAYGKPER